jgi:hypothetical protein
MPITTSTILWDQAQADGRRYIRERHVDHLAIAHLIDYLAPAGADVNAILAARAVALVDDLAQEEIAADLAAIYVAGPLAVVTTNHVTLSDVRTALRNAYKTVTREQAFALGAFLNTLTNTQLGNLFGVSGAQLTALRTRLQTKATQWADYIAAVGE